jgi:hypothetical protein
MFTAARMALATGVSIMRDRHKLMMGLPESMRLR